MIDKCNLTIESGKGGDGMIAFDNNRKADGGDGGDGGDVYVVGDSNVYDLSKLSELKKVKAQNGENGNKNKKTGKKGDDLEIHLPLITKIFNDDNTEILTISKS
ncbi:MAG TPA: GTPase ObgE, partial [Candidatus Dojkabacteria bacterium]|nr:GTPase ObgE [Candidatus Dojkabacteria bacterium]